MAEPRKLRSQLRESDALISGSFAVQYFDRTIYHDSVLDIFVKKGEYARGLEEFLTLTEGYRLAYTNASRKATETDNNLDPNQPHVRSRYDISTIQRVYDHCLLC